MSDEVTKPLDPRKVNVLTTLDDLEVAKDNVRRAAKRTPKKDSTGQRILKEVEEKITEGEKHFKKVGEDLP